MDQEEGTVELAGVVVRPEVAVEPVVVEEKVEPAPVPAPRKPIEAWLVSKGKHGNTAEVRAPGIVLVHGECIKRWVTCHLIRKDGRYMGWNPDKVAVALLDKAERELAEIQGFHNNMVVPLGQISVEDLQRFLEKITKYGSTTRGVPPLVLECVLDLRVFGQELKVEAVKAALEKEVVISAKALGVVIAEVRALQIKTPREVEFTFE
jgi:hypothetical protein